MKTKVLVADDEEEFVKTLAERLEIRGFSVTTVCSGEGAVEIVKKIDFDVIVLDVLMPEVSGIDALAQIKKEKPLIPVIMLTGEATVENAILGMKMGAFDFLMKPLDIRELINEIEKAIKG